MKEIKDDLTPMLKNLFKQVYRENPDDVTIISRNNLKFVPFLVSLNNNSKNFVLEIKMEFTQLESLIQWMNI